MAARGSREERLQRRVACVEFGADDINALRSLLGLLDPYLKHAWAVGNAEQADLLLVRLDGAHSPPAWPDGRTTVGVARRPREHPSPTIHRPLRASEILAVLNEAEEAVVADVSPPAAEPAPDAQAWRLDFWPLDFETCPRPWRRVMAALSARAMTADDLVKCTRIAPDDVDRCLQWLRETDALSNAHRPSPPRTPPAPRWRHLIAGIGRKLGFSH